MKTAKIILPLIALLLLSSCIRRVKSVTITGVNVQKVVFDNYNYKGCRDKDAYMFSLQFTKNFAWYFVLNTLFPGAFLEDGVKEDIYDIEITDSMSQSIKDHTSFVRRYGEDGSGFIVKTHAVSKDIRAAVFENWEDAIGEIQYGARKIFMVEDGMDSNPILFYVNEDCSRPEYFIIKFKDREIRAKVNNTPIVLHDISDEY